MRPALALLSALLFLLPASAAAHLSIIRQGFEAAGSNEADDRTGATLATGDFNGDGYDDLVMGAPTEDIAGAVDAGAIVVNWGSMFGVTHENSQLLTANVTGGTYEAGAQFGAAVVSGNFDGDAYDDLVIGAPYEDALGVPNAGRIYVLRGSANGLVNWYVLEQDDFTGSVEPGDRFGSALAVGNFDGDPNSYDDLAIGSPGEDGNQGAVFWRLGTPTGPVGATGWFKISTFGQVAVSGDELGSALASANLVGGPQDDLAVSAPGRANSGSNGAGVVWLIHGANPGLSAVPAPIGYSALWVGNPQTNGQFGYALATGHFFTGSYESLAIGEPGRYFAGNADAGRVIVVEGGAVALDFSSAQILTQAQAGETPQFGDRFGASLDGGYFWFPGDGFEDIAVGSPGESFGIGAGQAGYVQIFPGGPSGPTGAGWSAFSQGVMGESSENYDALGTAVAFGNFDLGGKGNLAVGAPGEDSSSGLVHVIAPWRQTFGMSHQRSVVYDCEDNLVFSQKPFDRVWIASTTKIMTVLLACEHIQAGADSNAVYTVPAWCAINVNGSQVPLVTGEQISLIDLMYAALMRSGNDAAFAIADHLYGAGGPDASVALFVQEKVQRAGQLGMAGTLFHNPAGLDTPPVGIPVNDGHYSTPESMAKLSRAAMNNPLFAQIAGTQSRVLQRNTGSGFQPWTCNNIFNGVLLNGVTPLTGIKGGGTPCAQATGCFSAKDPGTGGTTIVGHYTTPFSVSNLTYTPDAVQLIQLGLDECGYAQILTHEFYGYLSAFKRVPSSLGLYYGGGAELLGTSDMAVDFYRTQGSDDASMQMQLGRVSENIVGPGEEVSYGVAPFFAHDSLRIWNMGDLPASILVDLSYAPDTPLTFDLTPGEWVTIPPHDPGVMAPQFTMRVENTDPIGAPIHLSVEEAYRFEVLIPAGGAGGGRSFGGGAAADYSIALTRDGAIVGDGFDFWTTGEDPIGAGSEFMVVVHDVDLDPAVGVAELEDLGDAQVAGGEDLRLLAVAPNPVRESTDISFELAREGRVSVSVYDVSGRRVRRLESSLLPAGRSVVRWDGRAGDGQRVATGAYFFQVRFDDRPAAHGTLIVVR